jgi:hypothetical protein
MALESVEALAVRTRLSESHCYPPREMRRCDMGGVAMRAITAHRAWPLHVDDWRSGVALKAAATRSERCGTTVAHRA